MPPVAYVSHALAERLRLRIPTRKGDAAYFAVIEKTFSGHDQVTHVETNPLTGSVLLYHHTDQAALVDFAQKQQLFQLQPDAPVAHRALQAAEEQVERADRTIRRLTQGSFDLNDLLFVGLLGAAAIQTLRGRILGPSAALLSYAAAILAFHRTQQLAK